MRTAAEEWNAPRKSPLTHCWEAVRSQFHGSVAPESCLLVFEPTLAVSPERSVLINNEKMGVTFS